MRSVYSTWLVILMPLLGLGKKSKDYVEARLDLKEMNIRPALWPQQQASGRTYLLPTYFTMSPKEKRLFYEVLENVKFPYGYASNISRCIRKRNLSGLKTHDCHVILQELLPIALRRSADKRVTSVLIDLCSYFRVVLIFVTTVVYYSLGRSTSWISYLISQMILKPLNKVHVTSQEDSRHSI